MQACFQPVHDVSHPGLSYLVCYLLLPLGRLFHILYYVENVVDVQRGPEEDPVLILVVLQRDLVFPDADILRVFPQIVAQAGSGSRDLLQFGFLSGDLVVGI